MSVISLFWFKKSGVVFSQFLLPCKDIKSFKRRSYPKYDKKNNKGLITLYSFKYIKILHKYFVY